MTRTRAFIRTSITTAAVAGVALVVTLSFTLTGAHADGPVPATPLEIFGAATRAGLTPQALAAAGVDDENVSGIVGRFRSYLADHIADLRTADSQCAADVTQIQVARRAGGMGHASPVEAPSPTQAATAINARRALLNAALDAAMTGIGSEQKARLVSIRANKQWEVPIEYKVASRTESEWVALRNALARKRQNAEAPAPAADSEAAVMAARSALSELSAIKTAYMNAMPTIEDPTP